MANGTIPISKYVNVLSVFSGGNASGEREPIARLFTENSLAPYGRVLEFTSAKNVLGYFGASSQEYSLAKRYFSFMSKEYTLPQKISFARYNSDAMPASLTSGINTFTLSALQAITNGNLSIVKTLADGTSQTISITGVDLSSITSLADVATTLNGKLNGQLTASFNADLNGSRFVITDKTADSGSQIAYLGAATGSLADALGLSSATGVIISDGKDETTIVEDIDNSANVSDNFYTFSFVDFSSFVIADIQNIAQWNEEQNNSYLFVVQPTSPSLYSSWAQGLAQYSGVWLQYDATGESQYIMPMAATACIDYSQEHAAINYMYQTFENFTPNQVMGKVGAQRLYEVLDGLNVNYYASTQNGGTPLSFLQDGFLTNGLSATVYINGIWLKATIVQKIMELFILNNALYANKDDGAKVAAACAGIWSLGKTNGSILVGKALSETEKAAIYAFTKDGEAWKTIRDEGYIFTWEIRTNSDTGRKYFYFKLLYAGCDTINSVEGVLNGITSTAA